MTARGQEHPAHAAGPQPAGRVREVVDLVPVVAFPGRPGRTQDPQVGNAHLGRRLVRVGGHLGGEGVGGIDQRIEAAGAQRRDQAIRTAEATDADRARQRADLAHPPGEGRQHVDTGPGMQPTSQVGRLGRPGQQEDRRHPRQRSR